MKTACIIRFGLTILMALASTLSPLLMPDKADAASAVSSPDTAQEAIEAPQGSVAPDELVGAEEPAVIEPAAETGADDAAQQADEEMLRLKESHCLEDIDCNITAIDRTRDYIAQKLSEPAAWFDSFFSTELIDEELSSQSNFRLRNSFTRDEYGEFDYEYSFKADVRLPNLSNRLNLLIIAAGDDFSTLDTPKDIVNPEDDTPVLESSDAAGNRIRIALRYFLLDSFISKFSIDSGIRVNIPPDPYLRANYRLNYPIGKLLNVRLTETVYWTVVEGAGEDTKIYFERLFGESTLFRWTNSASYTEKETGFSLSSTISLSRQLSSRRGVAVYAGVTGETSPAIISSEYVTGIKYRQVVYRKWIFYELEPRVSWPRDEPDGHNSITSFTIHFEFNFDYQG